MDGLPMDPPERELVLPEDVRSAPTPARSPVPDDAFRSKPPGGVIHFTVSLVSWNRMQRGTMCTVSGDADTWAAGSSGSVTLVANDASLDHIRVGDVLTLTVDEREAA